MGAVTSRPVLHTVETGLLAVARLIDAVVRAIDRLLSALVAKLLPSSFYTHFYVNPPGEAVADVGPDGLTRICTNDGLCYVPATKLHQHRLWQKKKQEDRLKQRKMRAEWAAAGLDVRAMTKMESEKRKSKQQLSRTTTMDKEMEEKQPEAAKEKPLYVMGNIAPSPKEEKKSFEPTQQGNKTSYDQPMPLRAPERNFRTLTSVREASHDHGAILPFDRTSSSSSNTEEKERQRRKRRRSAPSNGTPLLNKVERKGAASVEATSATRIARNVQNKLHSGGGGVLLPTFKGHRSTASLPVNVQGVHLTSTNTGGPSSSSSSSPSASANPSTAGLILVQPKPRRPIKTSFDANGQPFHRENRSSVSLSLGGVAIVTDLTPPTGQRFSPTPTPPPPPPVAFRTRTRNSFDISPAATPFAVNDDASSIRSKRSLPGYRSSTPNSPTPTPPPCVVQLADRACKSRWEASSKERKGWKGEVKRLALNKVHEQHHAYVAALRSSTPNATESPSSPTSPSH